MVVAMEVAGGVERAPAPPTMQQDAEEGDKQWTADHGTHDFEHLKCPAALIHSVARPRCREMVGARDRGQRLEFKGTDQHKVLPKLGARP